MKNAFVNHSLEYLIKNNACTEKQKNIFRYTLESLYSFLVKTIVILFISMILKTTSITIIMIFLYSLLRGFAFGIHATKNSHCWIITLCIYIIIPLFIKYCTFPLNFVYVIFGISMIAFILWSPSDTPSRPLINKKKRNANKIITIIIGLIYILSSFYFNNSNYYEIVSAIFFIEAFCINPITYKLFHVPYNNYKNYKK